jgi:hypothetical protein
MKISGHVDLCGPDLIEGWLYSDIWDDTSIKLQVYVGADLLGECTVDRFRADLQEAGFGDGRCGFSFVVPPDISSLDFTATRLRFVDSPVYLLPDDHTVFAPVARAADELPGEAKGKYESNVGAAPEDGTEATGRTRWPLTRRATYS